MTGTRQTQVVGIFDSEDALEAAVEQLQTQGFDHADISLLTTDTTVEEKLGVHYERPRKVANSGDEPREAYVGKVVRHEGQAGLVGGLIYVPALAASGAVVASGGALLPAVLAAAAAGTAGGALGVVLARLVERQHAEDIEEQVSKGGLVLWVRTADAAGETKARKVLEENHAHHIHSHEFNELPDG